MDDTSIAPLVETPAVSGFVARERTFSQNLARNAEAKTFFILWLYSGCIDWDVTYSSVAHFGWVTAT